MNRRTAILAAAAGLGRLAEAEEVRTSGVVIEVTFDPGEFDVGKQRILEWVSRAASAVAAYYGRFPVTMARLHIRPLAGRDGVRHGVTFGSTPASTRISVGEHTTEAQLRDDWVLTHEFVHMGFPSLARRHHWLEEGLATYVEPIARVQAGQLKPERLWADLVRDIPQGEPQPGDNGLDRTRSWANTYWGGALFCFDADVRIREATHNRYGLQHALRGILAAGGNIETEWPVARALEAGDRAVGVPVLSRLYEERKDTPVPVDLASLWRRLGVIPSSGSLTFDNHAPLAGIRRAITARLPAG
ncbi:MAG: hypothetical protein IT165_00985 [Bryobacterales bacterium]|nr:hypothetical protein [Bryobacterales bacterium]